MIEQTLSQATKEYLNSSSEDPHKKFLWILSNLSAADLRMVNNDRKYAEGLSD